MDGWYTYTIIIGARNQHTASGAYEFHIHRAYIIYDENESRRKNDGAPKIFFDGRKSL